MPFKLEHKTATITPEVGEPYELDYDHIVMTAGSVSRTFPIPGVADVAIGDGRPRQRSSRRAAELRPWVEQADWLLDIHSMSNSEVPLQLTGLLPRNIELGLQLGTPSKIIADAGHAAGVRMRDYGRFGEPGDNGTRSLLIECGFHGAPSARDVAIDQMARFLAASGAFDRARLPDGWLMPDAPSQQALEVTHAITRKNENFRFAQPWQGLECLPSAGTLIGWNDDEEILTPYDNCVLIMPSLGQPRPGVTVVRLARAIA